MNIHLSSEKLNALNIIETLTKSIELFKKNPGQLLLVTFIGMIVSFFSLGILAGLISLNLFTIIKNIDLNNETPEVSKIFERLDRFIDSLILLLICFGLAIIITVPFAIFGYAGSIISMVISSSITSPVFYLAFQIMNEKEGTTPLEAFSSSFEIIKNSIPNGLYFGAIMGILAAIPTLFETLMLIIPTIAAAHSLNLCLARVIFSQISENSEIITPDSSS